MKYYVARRREAVCIIGVTRSRHLSLDYNESGAPRQRRGTLKAMLRNTRDAVARVVRLSNLERRKPKAGIVIRDVKRKRCCDDIDCGFGSMAARAAGVAEITAAVASRNFKWNELVGDSRRVHCRIVTGRLNEPLNTGFECQRLLRIE